MQVKPYELIESQCMLSNGELYFLYFREGSKEANPGENILASGPATKTHKAKNVSVSPIFCILSLYFVDALSNDVSKRCSRKCLMQLCTLLIEFECCNLIGKEPDKKSSI